MYISSNGYEQIAVFQTICFVIRSGDSPDICIFNNKRKFRYFVLDVSQNIKSNFTTHNLLIAPLKSRYPTEKKNAFW